MKGNRSKNLPGFRSVDEFVAFFESHDMGEYWEKLTEAGVEVGSKKKVGTGNPKGTYSKTKSSTNTGKRWTATQGQMASQISKPEYAHAGHWSKAGPTENAVRTKASKNGVSLKSRNQSSSYRRKK